MEVIGPCVEELMPIKEAFQRNFDESLELGASIAAMKNGEIILDLVGGSADKAETLPWQANSIACVFSSTKLMTICSVLVCLERGLLEIDARVSDYWTEFGQSGKQDVTVRDALTHRALVPGFKEKQPFGTDRNWERMISLIEQEPAWFKPGTFCYHPVTYGFILGQLVKIVSGESIQTFFNKRLAEPLQADLQIGLSDREDRSRVVEFVYPTEIFPFAKQELAMNIMTSIDQPPEDFDRWLDWESQSMVSPAVNGFTNALGLVKLGDMLVNKGSANGQQILSSALVAEATREQVHAECPIIGEVRMGLGFGLDSPGFPGPSERSFHWGGWGGSWCFMDPETGITMGYVMNNCIVNEDIGDPRMERIWQVYRDLSSVL